ncbi:hypothetical protein ABNQ39_20800 [Azospirillum sp. A26]|uniref:hypothetical protein n=1 Tax=Azospirillum sp. A26 TaxID=3160607 RepID=UPI00367274DF
MTREEREDAVRRLNAKGMNDIQIADETGMPYGTVSDVRTRLGLPTNGVSGRKSPATDADISAWMAEGLSRVEMAERSGLAVSTIKRRVQKIRGVSSTVPTVSQHVRQIDRFLAAFRPGCYLKPANSRMAETSNRDGNRIIGLPVAICTASSLYGA